MTDNSLKQISIDELVPGMFVDRIAKQSGKLKVTSRGKVTKPAIVDSLRKRGVLAVVIDPSKQFIPDDEQATPEIKLPEAEQVKEQGKSNNVAFDKEVRFANKLHKKGKSIQKRMLNNVAKGLPTDIAIPEDFTQNLVGSIDRNPNALLCLTKIREKDDYLLEHSLNVAILLANFAKYMDLEEQVQQELALAGFLHDIGKIKIPDEILHKPAKLTEPEMNIMRDHVVFGLESLQEMGISNDMLTIVGEHHERLDGYGYPEGKRHDEISYYGRMIAIVDVYDALTADRVYKSGMPSQKALQILLKDTPDKYDRELVQKFIKCIGIFPVGSLVKLSNSKIAMVLEHNEDAPLKPKVKVFYSIRGSHYVSPEDIDLSKMNGKISVDKAVLASDYKLNFNAFFEEKIAN